MASLPAPIAAHPNATVAGGFGGLGVLAVWLLGRFGVPLTGEEAASVSTGASGLGLLIGKRGFHGLLRVLWKGTG